MDPSATGQNVGDVTGSWGILEGVNRGEVYSEGYPGSGPFGRYCGLYSCFIRYCDGPVKRVVTDYYSGVNEIGAGCITGHGASGGPWFAQYQGQWYVASVTSTGVSFWHQPYFRNIWGPQFDSSLDQLLTDAESQ
jgi:hypothetical protein